MPRPLPPTSETELQQRLDSIAGLTVAELAEQLNIDVPADLRHHKGWLGDLAERALGCDAASLSEPDFTKLGIELKTLPVNNKGQVQESTYICTVPLKPSQQGHWLESCVYKKLRHVLWLPVQASAEIPLAERHIGSGLLWRAPENKLTELAQDWEELMSVIALGKFESLSAQHGDVLQIRPKAANASVLVEAIGPEGQTIQTLPRGFYLRPHFTNTVLTEHFLSN
ncbi:MAG: DNA mismatch repair endonuclease MutH [Sulfuriflexus sp.]|nr:DNA mismatch repair endonuclease MutH [Sulfuriflexus sp.]